MNDLAEYIELVVEPTFEDFSRNAGSVRHAYLACLVIYHAVDRVDPDHPSALAKQWMSECPAFVFIDEVAQHFKHGQRRWVKKAKEKAPDALLITHPLGLEGDLKGLKTRHLFFHARDAVLFLREKAKLAAPKAQAPASPRLP